MKEWTIQDIIDEELWINFDREYTKEIFNGVNSIDFTKVYGYNTLYNYWKTNNRSKNLNHLKKILSYKNRTLDLNKITYIKPRTGFELSTKCFPIKMDKNLSKLVGHLLGDGGIGLGKRNPYRVHYTGNDIELIKSVIKCVESIFGKVKHDLRERDGCYFLIFPSIIGIVIKNMFKNKWGTYDGYIPDEIMNNKDNRIKIACLQALFDDECSLSKQARQISLGLANKKLTLQIKELLNDVDIEVGFSQGKYVGLNRFTLSISGRMNQRLFLENIGLTNKTEKDYRFRNYFNNLDLHGEFEVRRKIIKQLKTKGMSRYELSKSSKKSLRMIDKYLSDMKKEGRISRNNQQKFKKGEHATYYLNENFTITGI